MKNYTNIPLYNIYGKKKKNIYKLPIIVELKRNLEIQ